MGTCAKCGASVADNGSYRKAYANQLSAFSKVNHELIGFQRLFAEKLIINHQNQLFMFSAVDAARLGVAKYLPSINERKEN